MKSIYSVSRKSLEQYFIDKKMPKFRATQVFEGLYKQDVDNLFKWVGWVVVSFIQRTVPPLRQRYSKNKPRCMNVVSMYLWV